MQLLTAYAFSTENWNRDPVEVQTLMTIFAQYAEKLRTEALAHNVKVNVLSTDPARLPDNVKTAIAALETATAHCTSFTVNICLRYVCSRSSAVLPVQVCVFFFVWRRRVWWSTVLTPTAPPSACLALCVNSYGSRGEIVNACRSVAAQVQAGQLRAEEVNEGHLQAALCAKGDFPDPDVLIRTSGEHRLSNFLLWQVSRQDKTRHDTAAVQ